MAVRRGDWKLHSVKGKVELVYLDTDISEKENVAATHPDKVKELSDAFDKWIAEMAAPINGGKKRADRTSQDVKKPLTEREIKR